MANGPGLVDHARSGTAIRDSLMLREAARLAADDELGNSDAIRLLQIPHVPEDVRRVLAAFDRQLSREARSKLTLEALVPLPDTVVNQRFEPLFDKYIITGDTYRTANGAVVPKELQYYNGEMVHLYGECSNVAGVNDALAGSGYRPATVKYVDGPEAAVAQLWCSRFADSSIRPYNAMFIVVVAVRSDSPAGQGTVTADRNGASSVLSMVDGSVDPASRVYENHARLFLFRLIDTTQVAIDVGRERMGTDKRPGAIDLTRDGKSIRLSVLDGQGQGVVRGTLALASEPAAYLREVAQAGATAGIALRSLPPGTERSYPVAARIGQGPIVTWEWRSDLAPRLQAVTPNALVIDGASEEGRILRDWGFTPKVLGYTPNVRGVVTGLSDGHETRRPAIVRAPAHEDEGLRTGTPQQSVSHPHAAVTRQARDGSLLTWGTPQAGPPPRTLDAGAPMPIIVTVSPSRPGHSVTVEYRCQGGPVRQVTAWPAPPNHAVNGRLFHATIPARPGGSLVLQPVLHFAGQAISPRLADSADHPANPVEPGPAHVAVSRSASSSEVAGVEPRWQWGTAYLGTLTANLRKELVGAVPDGLRIDWYVTDGSFVGPHFEATVLPGAADWMRIRKDGVGIVNVQACFETRAGARIDGSYGGHFDLGAEGYARALRDEYDSLPPVVVTPTYATADAQFAWLNRAQCLGVGRVDMTAFRVQFDVYVVRVGGRADEPTRPDAHATGATNATEGSLYKRMGGYDVIAPMADEFIASIVADKRLGRLFVSGYTEARIRAIRQQVVDQLCQITGGPCVYTGRDMKTAHKGLGITNADWDTAAGLLIASLTKYRVAPKERLEFMQIIEGMKNLIVERAG